MPSHYRPAQPYCVANSEGDTTTDDPDQVSCPECWQKIQDSRTAHPEDCPCHHCQHIRSVYDHAFSRGYAAGTEWAFLETLNLLTPGHDDGINRTPRQIRDIIAEVLSSKFQEGSRGETIQKVSLAITSQHHPVGCDCTQCLWARLTAATHPDADAQEIIAIWRDLFEETTGIISLVAEGREAARECVICGASTPRTRSGEIFCEEDEQKIQGT